MARPTPLQPYIRASLPIIEGGDVRFIQKELQSIETAFADLVLMTPQMANVAPKTLRDGMIRLARSPWWPVSGQSADAWVWFDAVSGIWRYL